METAENMRCPKCKKISIELISLNDKGKGKKVCKRCKNKIVAVNKK